MVAKSEVGFGSHVLRATNLAKSFRDGTHAFSGVSLRVASGEVVAIMGPSGSGKSTLLLCLAGVLRADSGTVTFAGAKLTDLPERDLTKLRREKFAFVFQLGLLVNEMTALRNVSLPLILQGISEVDAMRASRAAMAQLGVEHLAGKRPGQVSVGQAQRIAVARALSSRAAIIFADEPTGSVDTDNGNLVFDALCDTTKRGASVLLVTHDESVAERADRVIVMRDGRIYEEP